jgi:predicted XRE-type DNA-binding protein
MAKSFAMKKSLGEQVAAFMEARNLNPSSLARLVGTTRQNIDNLKKRDFGQPRYIKELASAMETTVDVLLAGKYVPQTAEKGSNSVDASDTNTNTDEFSQIIPTSAMFTPVNLSTTILLLGSMLARMDPRSRRVMGVLLSDLAEAPDDAQDVADKAAGIASKQKAVTSSKSLDAAIQGKEGAFVETVPSKLE